jgi:hypothetical protein
MAMAPLAVPLLVLLLLAVLTVLVGAAFVVFSQTHAFALRVLLFLKSKNSYYIIVRVCLSCSCSPSRWNSLSADG